MEGMGFCHFTRFSGVVFIGWYLRVTLGGGYSSTMDEYCVRYSVFFSGAEDRADLNLGTLCL